MLGDPSFPTTTTNRMIGNKARCLMSISKRSFGLSSHWRRRSSLSLLLGLVLPCIVIHELPRLEAVASLLHTEIRPFTTVLVHRSQQAHIRETHICVSRGYNGSHLPRRG